MHNSPIKVGQLARFRNPEYPRLLGTVIKVTTIIGTKIIGIDSAGNSREFREYNMEPWGTESTAPSQNSSGLKHDGGKPRWYMLMTNCAKAMAGVMDVLEFGAKKYSPGSWATVPDAEIRYKDALYRHLHEVEKGDLYDAESGLLHYDHIATNAIFLSQLKHAQIADIDQALATPKQLELPLK